MGIELDPEKHSVAKNNLKGEAQIELLCNDFLTRDLGTFDYIIGNPPYVPIEELSEQERREYRTRFETARGRLDLYLLFWERALTLLRPRGRLTFITPEKFTYVETARPLRKLLSNFQVREIEFVPEDTFPTLTTYPTITTVMGRPPRRPTLVTGRDGQVRRVQLPRTGASWQPAIHESPELKGRRRLVDVAVRVSCGVATGADRVFVIPSDKVPGALNSMSYPAIAGRDLRNGGALPVPRRRLLVPYNREGILIEERNLGPLGRYFRRPEVKAALEARTCVNRKPWYAFHDSMPLPDILRPKLLCKDITSESRFWVDRDGGIVPLHSVYYVVPRDPEMLVPLAKFLNSEPASRWLWSHCQRAANGFLRVQSAALKQIPIPDDLLELADRRIAES